MVKKLYYSLFTASKCPWCGKKWMWTRARRSLISKYGKFDLSCRCGKEWKVVVKEEGYEYIEK